MRWISLHIGIVLILTFLVFSQISTAGITEKTVVFSLGAGVDFPTGPPDFTRYWGAGPNINADIAYEFGKRLKVGLAVDYSVMSIDRALVDADAAEFGATELRGDNNITSFGISGSITLDLFDIKNKVTPFIKIKVGDSWQNIEYVLAIRPDSAQVLALPTNKGRVDAVLVGIGADYKVSNNWKMFLDFNYRELLTHYYVRGGGTGYPHDPAWYKRGRNTNFIYLSLGARYLFNFY